MTTNEKTLKCNKLKLKILRKFLKTPKFRIAPKPKNKNSISARRPQMH